MNSGLSPQLSPTKNLGTFLILVCVVRLLHFACLPTLVFGMTFRELVAAKNLLAFGFGHALLPSAPLVSLTIASLSSITGSSPAQVVPVFLLVVHVWLGAAFWFWTRQVIRDGEHETVRGFGLLLFLVFPGFNSYEGIRNLAALTAATACLQLLVVAHATPLLKPKRIAVMVLLAAIVILCRSEYLILLPMYAVLLAVLRGVGGKAIAWRSGLPRIGVIVVGLGMGIVVTIAVRARDAHELSLANRGYVTYTFLDGSPSFWLSEADDIELERVHRGMEHFGDPAKYNYSLIRIIASHPRATIEKCLLNLPRWGFELGRRHVVFSLPMLVLFVLGLLVNRNRDWFDGALVVSLLGMTLPLTGMILYAEYLVVACPALCVGAAAGLEWFRVVLLRGKTGLALVPAVYVIVVCEGLLIRGGGFLSKQWRPPVALAREIDNQLANADGERVVLDPPHDLLEATARTNFANDLLINERLLRKHGVIPPGRFFDRRETNLLELAEGEGAFRDRIERVVVWGTAAEVDRNRERVARWERLGFEVVRRQSSSDYEWIELRLKR